MSDNEHAETLRCTKCGTVSADGRGWRALLTVGDEDAEDVDEVAAFCPGRLSSACWHSYSGGSSLWPPACLLA